MTSKERIGYIANTVVKKYKKYHELEMDLYNLKNQYGSTTNDKVEELELQLKYLRQLTEMTQNLHQVVKEINQHMEDIEYFNKIKGGK